MSKLLIDPQGAAVLTYHWREIEGKPQPGLEDTVDEKIYTVMVDQRR